MPYIILSKSLILLATFAEVAISTVIKKYIKLSAILVF